MGQALDSLRLVFMLTGHVTQATPQFNLPEGQRPQLSKGSEKKNPTS